MKKSFVLLLALCMFALLSCGKKAGSYVESVSKSDTVTYSLAGEENTDRLQKFIDNVDKGKQDRINVVRYTTEGDPIITQLYFNGEDIVIAVDNSKDGYAGEDRYKIQYKTIKGGNQPKENLMKYLDEFGFSSRSKVSKSSMADYPYFSTIESAAKGADVIITGKIDKVVSGKNLEISNDGDDSFKYTVSDVTVEEVLKGNVKPGDKLQVKQLENETTSEEAGYFKKGEKYVMFLADYRSENSSMPFSLINPSQGRIEIKSDGTIRDNKNNMQDLKDGEKLEEVMSKIKAVKK